MTSDETDARDRARLEALQALAAEFPPDAPDAEPDLDVYVDALGEPLFEPIETGMVFQESPYVLGNINVIRADTRAAAEAFAALDPCAGVGGYAETAVYEWGLQKGEELNVPRGNGARRPGAFTLARVTEEGGPQGPSALEGCRRFPDTPHTPQTLPLSMRWLSPGNPPPTHPVLHQAHSLLPLHPRSKAHTQPATLV
jgi:hypothetical protein